MQKLLRWKKTLSAWKEGTGWECAQPGAGALPEKVAGPLGQVDTWHSPGKREGPWVWVPHTATWAVPARALQAALEAQPMRRPLICITW